MSSSSSNLLQFRPATTTIPTTSPFMLRRSSYGSGVFHRKRARFKRRNRSFIIVNSSPPFDGNAFSLDYFAPTLTGIVSGLAVSLFGRNLGITNTKRSVEEEALGEWILYTTPTPFNRFVYLRCSLLTFDDAELLDDRLLNEERHFGKILSTITTADDKSLEYQRICISTEDGGVISLDWPSNLDLREDRGLDTTVVYIPGTTEGSMDDGVRSFVSEARSRGVFPVVMNPRGCAGSPLTTARLFTAADSDDVSTLIRFLSKIRPWTTLVGVGRGYGANMLTKYLAEAGERTPLTAAVCIDTPFDLEEITRTSPYCTSLDQQLSGGLVEILQANKELFKGRTKAFDVGKALSSKSVRDFDKALSMVTNGFKSVEDFYSSCATRDVIGELKVPVLFIQNDDVVPLYSTPRTSIAENPFTSLLLCSSSPSLMDGQTVAVSWCQDLAIEWLTAVELGLLKGRHPLLKDVDVTVNPSKGLVLSEARAPEKGIGAKKLLQVAQGKTVNGYHGDPFKEALEESDITPTSSLPSATDLEQSVTIDNGSDEPENGKLLTSGPVEVELVEDNESNIDEGERGQVLQTAEVVMNMLDVTMPGTLKAEAKKKVMDAVGRGETVVSALQDAVPEEVRGKLTTAVTEILQSPGSKLNLQNLKLPSLSQGVKSKEEASKAPSSTTGVKDSHSPDAINKSDGLVSGSDSSAASKASHKDDNTGKSQSDCNQGDSSVLTKKGNSEPGSSLGNHESSVNENTSASDGSEKASEAKIDSTNQAQPKSSEDVSTDVDKVDQGSVIAQQQRKEEANRKDEKGAPSGNEKASAADGSEKASTAVADSTNQGPPIAAEAVTSDGDKVDQGDVSAQEQRKEESRNNENATATDQNNVASTGKEGDAGQSSASNAVKTEGIDDQKKETEIMEPISDQTKPAIQEPNEAKFNVSQAFEALTGMDDSTQVAVNSVFGVLENMITQMDEENKEGNEVSDEKTPKDEKNVTNEKNDTDVKIMSPSEEQTTNTKEAERQMSSEKPHETEDSSKEDKTTGVMNGKHLGGDESVISDDLPKVLLARNTDPLENSSHDGYLGEELTEKQIAEQLDLDTTTALMLDYNPEEGTWKLLDQQQEYLSNLADNAPGTRDAEVHSTNVSHEENIIEPSYVTLGHEEEVELSEMHDAAAAHNQNDSRELEHLIKVIVSDSLNVEVQRRMNSAGMRQFESQLSRDIERVANTLSSAVVYTEPTWTFDRNCKISSIPAGKVGRLRGDAIIRAISSAVQEAHFLRKVLPVGVVVGSVLAVLRKYFDVSTTADIAKRDIVMGGAQKNEKNVAVESVKRDIVMGGAQEYEKNVAVESVGPTKISHKSKEKNSSIGEMVESGLENISNEPVMVGAMTAALGASAMLAQHEDPQGGGIMSKQSGNGSNLKDQGGMVASFAEKAMSIAGPAVPTKETGEVDHDRYYKVVKSIPLCVSPKALPDLDSLGFHESRIVNTLADLGQRGGILRLVGKLALLWGGLRGAMSLTDKLIQFLRIEEWPLPKRAVGFAGMVLVLWSPVVIPLLPTLLQSWSTSTPSRVAELASVVGLYVAVFILIMLWGKRVRKYENPFKEYGLDFKASVKKQIKEFFKALAGGITVVLLIQSINAILGAAVFSQPPYLPLPFDTITWLKGCTQLLLLIGRGFSAATFVVFVEELLFRSWMPNEIAIDMGYHQSIVITGLIFALFQRSLRSIPGLWLLSLGLTYARERNQGNLIVPIGLRTGMIAASFILHTGGFLTYNPSSSIWIAGTRPLQPFSGLVGLTVALALALVLYPRHSAETKMQICNQEEKARQ